MSTANSIKDVPKQRESLLGAEIHITINAQTELNLVFRDSYSRFIFIRKQDLVLNVVENLNGNVFGNKTSHSQQAL